MIVFDSASSSASVSISSFSGIGFSPLPMSSSSFCGTSSKRFGSSSNGFSTFSSLLRNSRFSSIPYQKIKEPVKCGTSIYELARYRHDILSFCKCMKASITLRSSLRLEILFCCNTGFGTSIFSWVLR